MCRIAAYTVASHKVRDVVATTAYRFVQARRKMNRNQKPVKVRKSRGEGDRDEYERMNDIL